MAHRLRFVPFFCIAAVLLFTYRLYASSYFWLDDFTALSWAQQESALKMLGHIINPLSQYFRPTGMLFYWIMLRVFDLNAPAYHYVAWSIHAANTALVYVILKRITDSSAGAAVGAMLFASEAVFVDLYWSFGTIFELVCAFAMFTGILLWNTENRSWSRVVLCLVVFVFAVKAKEMAITLPAIWLGCDLLLRSKPSVRAAFQIVIPASFGLWYGFIKMMDMRGLPAAAAYYMDVKWLTLGRGYGAYFNQLFNTNLRWQFWAIGFAALLLFFAIGKMRTAVFFQMYTFVTFLPLVFLVNRHEAFYWYIPILGLCGLAALMVKALVEFIEPRFPARIAPPAAAAVFATLCWGTYVVQRNETDERRQWQQRIAAEYRSWIAHLRSLPQPQPNETLFFESYPSLFDSSVLHNAAQVAFRRTDIDAKVVETKPR